MKTIFRLGWLGFALGAVRLAGADGAEPTAPRPPTPMHREVARIVREESGPFTPAPPDVETEEVALAFPTANTIALEPMTVNGRRILIPPPRHESPTQEFFRTGTIWEKSGPRFTLRLWMKGDRGILFSILW